MTSSPTATASAPPRRIDALAKVTGAATYAADISRPGTLWAKALRSPHPHARIVSIDTRRARALPGVHAVLTGQDLPDYRVGRAMRDMPVLARDKVRFIGEKVAAVAADTMVIAEEALSLIEVEYEELPAVFDPLEAIQPDAPLIHEPADVRRRVAPKQVVPDFPNGVSQRIWGASMDEVEQAFAQADHVVEHTFHTPYQHQVYLEPHACTVEIDGQGVAHIWASNKAPFLLLTYLERGIELTRDRVQIHLLPLGGDFGGKGSFMDIPLAYFLAKATRRPVRLLMSYTEEMMAGNPRHACTLVVRSAVAADGRITARLLRAYFTSGGYAAFKPSPDAALPGIRRGAYAAYHIPVMRVEANMIYTNTVPGGHMRSPGEAQTSYAVECHMELLARELGFDPIEFRILNAPTAPRPTETGEPGSPPRAAEVLRAAAQGVGWGTPKSPDVGRGIALIEFTTSPGIYSAGLVVRRDGHVVFRTPIVENGSGSLTVFRQIVAEEFGISPHDVTVEQTTEGFDEDRGVGGSRVTRLEGRVAIQLVHTAQARLADLLAAELGVSAAEVRAEPGGFRLPGGRFTSLAEAASLADEDVVEILRYEATAHDASIVYMAEGAEIRVDRETGAIKLLRVSSAHEVGRVIDPLLFQTQIDGGLTQGIGYALMEGLNVEDGRVTNLNLHEYKIPTIADLPELKTVLLPPDLSLGITPIGEGPTAGITPAIVNALVDVLGPRPFDIPLRPETVQRVAAERAASA